MFCTRVCLFLDKPREPIVTSRNLYPEEGKKLIAECVFDAKPPATVFYVKVDEETNQWNRSNASSSQVCYVYKRSNVLFHNISYQYSTMFCTQYSNY